MAGVSVCICVYERVCVFHKLERLIVFLVLKLSYAYDLSGIFAKVSVSTMYKRTADTLWSGNDMHCTLPTQARYPIQPHVCVKPMLYCMLMFLHVCCVNIPCPSQRSWWGRSPSPARRLCGSWRRWLWVERWRVQTGWGTLSHTSQCLCLLYRWHSETGAVWEWCFPCYHEETLEKTYIFRKRLEVF